MVWAGLAWPPWAMLVRIGMASNPESYWFAVDCASTGELNAEEGLRYFSRNVRKGEPRTRCFMGFKFHRRNPKPLWRRLLHPRTPKGFARTTKVGPCPWRLKRENQHGFRCPGPGSRKTSILKGGGRMRVLEKDCFSRVL